MDYAKLIKELRVVLIISQTELAEMLGVSFSTVNRWENGRHEPTIKAKKKLHELFIQNNMIGDKANDNK
jgi:DNA-binding transcriptional regulator YiaG